MHLAGSEAVDDPLLIARQALLLEAGYPLLLTKMHY
jgi:hypothetical protein